MTFHYDFAHYAPQIRSRLLAEGARNTSDAELERCLLPCVLGKRLLIVAKYLREEGELAM